MDLRGCRSTCWSLTCNLQTVSRATVDHCIESARSLGWGVEGQLERGAEGTLHYQLMVKTPQVRFSAVKKVFPTAHIEPARNREALEQYVHKEETREGLFKKIEVKFLTYPQVRNQFFKWYVDQVESGERLPPLPDADERMRVWDEFIGLSIEEGMECDLIGMNPQHRGCINKYWKAYIAREAHARHAGIVDNTDTDARELSPPENAQQDGVYSA